MFISITGKLKIVLFSFLLLTVPITSLAAVNFTALAPITKKLSSAEDVSFGNNKIHVVDGYQNRITVFDNYGRMLSTIPLSMPTSVAAAASGDIIYAGSNADLSVKILNYSGEIIGVLGQGPGEFKLPKNISVDQATGNVYVVDQLDHSIKVYSAAGEFISRLDDSPNLPQDIAIYNNELFVVDQPIITSGSGKIRGARIQVFDAAGIPTRSFGTYGTQAGQFIRPRGITVDGHGNLFVSDSLKGEVFVFTSAGGFLGTITQPDTTMLAPQGISVTGDKRLLVASSFSGGIHVFGLVMADGSTPWENIAPVANAGTDQTVAEGTVVALSALQSMDADDGIVSYTWQQTAGPLVILTDSSDPAPEFSAPLIDPLGATLSFRLTIKDFRGLESSDLVQINVTNILSGAMEINNGAFYTTDPVVTLTLDALDASQMCFSNDNTKFDDCAPYAATHSWTLASGDGVKNVSVRFIDKGGNTSEATDSITLDSTAPPPPVDVTGTGTLTGGQILTWNKVNGATTYVLKYAANGNFTNSVIISLTGTSFEVEHPSGDALFWRVKAIDKAGNAGAWSSISQINLVADGAVPSVKTCKSTITPPVLVAPANGANNVDLAAVLSAAEMLNLKECGRHRKTEWQISRNSEFTDMIMHAGMVDENLTEFTVPQLVLEENTTSFWRVKYWTESDDNTGWSNEFSFTTRITAEDLNNDGVADNQEIDGITDLDEDGTDDALQTNLKCVKTVSENTEKVCLGSQGKITPVKSLKAITKQSIADKRNSPNEMPMGLFSFKVEVPTPGDTANVTIYLSDAVPAGTKWMKYDSINGWQDFSAYATFSNDRKSVVLTLQDGGPGDADGVANGVIIDPSGPAFNTTAVTDEDSAANSLATTACILIILLAQPLLLLSYRRGKK